MSLPTFLFSFFFFNDTATTEIYTLSLHDALPISRDVVGPDPPAHSGPPAAARRAAGQLCGIRAGLAGAGLPGAQSRVAHGRARRDVGTEHARAGRETPEP